MSSNSHYMPNKAAEVAAFFLLKAEAALHIIKIMKLMYLAERESLLNFAEPLIGDSLVSMQHGPVLSATYSQMRGDGQEDAQILWDSWIDERTGHGVCIKPQHRHLNPDSELLSLSDSDVDILNTVWTKFGHMNTWALRDYTHTAAVPEWQDPDGSSLPISYTQLFKAAGKPDAFVTGVITRLSEQAAMRNAFAAKA